MKIPQLKEIFFTSRFHSQNKNCNFFGTIHMSLLKRTRVKLFAKNTNAQNHNIKEHSLKVAY